MRRNQRPPLHLVALLLCACAPGEMNINQAPMGFERDADDPADLDGGGPPLEDAGWGLDDRSARDIPLLRDLRRREEIEPPPRDMAPPPDAALPRDMAPPPRDMAPPPRDMA
ncbi:hypothetical protein KJ940_13740, partial [Myxococcota bacterium]|nr:hypothetical protein [Myxococcota bacterium]